jgi:hypothetical protein
MVIIGEDKTVKKLIIFVIAMLVTPRMPAAMIQRMVGFNPFFYHGASQKIDTVLLS